MELDRDRLRTIGWVVAAVLVALLAVRQLTGGAEGGSPVTVEPAQGASGAATPNGDSQGGGSPQASGSLLVQVAGEVARPGVLRVPAGARVNDAVTMAGGLTRRAEPAGVNLVAKLADGQQVVVPRRGAAAGPGTAPGGMLPGGVSGPGPGGASGPGGLPGQRISLGSATPEQLDAVDGIGPTLARRIVEYGRQHGGFRSIDELRQVEGIGEKRFQALRAAVTP